LKLDGNLLEALVSLVLCDFNPDDSMKQEGFGRAELAIKKLFRVIAPDLPL
jgi:hypothetical protein